MKEFELDNEKYIGEFFEDDVEALCYVPEKYMYYATKFRGVENGYKTFNILAFFIGGAWFAYRGLMKEAFLFDLIGWIFTGALQVFWNWILLKDNDGLAVAIIGMVIYAIYIGLKATPYYYEHVKKVLKDKGLAGRKPDENKDKENFEIKKALLDEGKTSYKMAILHFIFFKVIGKLCWISLWLTIYGGNGIRFY